jgi:hypothetical protein
MGRTIPSFRITLATEKAYSKPFCNALEKKTKRLTRCGTFLNSTFLLAPIQFS